MEQLSDTQISLAIHLISTMHYYKGINKGNIYSLYLQKKANEYINQTLYECQVTNQELQESIQKLESDCKRLCQQNKTLIRKTQSFGVQNMQLICLIFYYLSSKKSDYFLDHPITYFF